MRIADLAAVEVVPGQHRVVEWIITFERISLASSARAPKRIAQPQGSVGAERPESIVST